MSRQELYLSSSRRQSNKDAISDYGYRKLISQLAVGADSMMASIGHEACAFRKRHKRFLLGKYRVKTLLHFGDWQSMSNSWQAMTAYRHYRRVVDADYVD